MKKNILFLTLITGSALFADLDIGIDKEAREKVANILNKSLANEFILYTKTLDAHWNVEGSNFSEMHAFFKSQYEALATDIDLIAERVRALGVKASGSLEDFLKDGSLKEKTNNSQTGLEYVKDLLKDNESIIKQLREDIKTASDLNDEGTANFLTERIEAHEKTAWMLRSFLK